MCEKIDGRTTPKSDHLEAHSGFNIGFDLNYWKKWCNLLDQKPSIPVRDAAKMMNSDEDNFMKKHPKLRYTEGHVWIYLKADMKDDCEQMLEVSE